MVWRKTKGLSAIGLVIVLIIQCFPAKAAAVAQRCSYANEINKASIMTFDITVEKDSWQSMLKNAMNEEYIPADVEINGKAIQPSLKTQKQVPMKRTFDV
jgi:hypothetical protein